MPEAAQSARYRFGRFEVIPSERRLLDSGQPVDVGPRAFNLLVALVERAGQLVGKDELLKRAWPGLVVEEGNLQVQVSNLRKVLGAEAIDTVSGHGYRFAPAVERAAAAPPAARRHNLPRELTSLVGREEQVAEQKRRFAQARLLTITGGGGLGKSRFSLRLAADLVDEYEDGVWLVELAAVAEPDNVTAAFAAVLGVPDGRGASLRDAVVGYVKERRLLLVVDNCEHVITAVAELAKLVLHWAPLVKLIATSREPLRVTGEVLYPLSPLGVPDGPPPIPLDAALHCAAVQLFAARAAASQPAFRVESGNVDAVATICRRLDGIPLALELAAARVRTLAVETLALRLADRFKLLNAGDRAGLPRHLTLRSTIDWSYDLLQPEERDVMSRLAVFAGGFAIEAVESVTANPEALDIVSRLVDKSLVVAEPDRDRYSMLETVRQYAHDRLVEAGCEAAAKDAHLAYFLAMAEALEPELIGPKQGAAYAALARERDNFLAAQAWCAQAADGAERGLRLVCALRMFWQVQGPVHLGYRLAAEALAQPGADPRGYPRCQALFASGTYAYFLGRYDEARRDGEACAALARDRGDEAKRADTLVLLASVALARSDVACAREHAAESLALARALDDRVRLAQALNTLGEAYAAAGDHGAARAAYDESVARARESGEQGSVAGTLVNLARVCVQQGDFAGAALGLLEAARVIEDAGLRHPMYLWLAIAGGFAAARGEWERAAMLWGAVEARSKTHGFALEAVDGTFVGERIAEAREALGDAAFAQARTAGAAPPDSRWLEQAREWLPAPPS